MLAIIALLLSFKKGRNSVWGGFTLGIVIGLIIAFIYFFKENSFHWSIIKNSVAVCVLIGFFFDILYSLIAGKEK
ncbi:MAG TPA: hypothetical protein PLS50_07345 [Candidatus Dojkabacteria bacterium]|nr:hypothetical protein [Candidatus Dojkabacteria bacterium]